MSILTKIIKDTTKPTTEFIADFKCEPVVNGVIRCKITNYYKLFDCNEYFTSGDECMEIVYRSMPTVKDSHSSIDKLWRVKDMFLCNLSYDGDFYIRVPVYLHPYDFEFGIKTYDTSNNNYWERSPTQTVNIPSFLSETVYTIGDKINFRNPLNCRVSDGKIMEKLDDGNYKILYERYNGTSDKIPTFSRELSVHISKIYRRDVGDQMVLQICDDILMYKNLLIQRKDKHSMDIFDAIKSSYEFSAQTYCYKMYGNDYFMFHWESMADFISKNIFEYLYSNEFVYKLDCLVDGTHGVLELSNLRVKDIQNDYNMLIHGVDNAQVDINSFDNIQYHCDCCRGLLSEWDYVYSCFTNDWGDMHDFCLLCVDTIIQLNKQLGKLLMDILKDIINVDCVKEIVNYVIGRVIYMEFESDKLDIDGDQQMVMLSDVNDNDSEKKRKLCDYNMPNAKKRKVS
eukprot:356028_1